MGAVFFKAMGGVVVRMFMFYAVPCWITKLKAKVGVYFGCSYSKKACGPGS